MNPTNANNDVQSPEREGTYTYRYPHPAVTTDCCIFTFVSGELAILLVRRGFEPYRGVWALPGGFVRINETAEQCARRELFEETGYGAERVIQFHTYSEVDRDPRERIITIAYYAIVKWGNVVGGDDADEAGWFSLSNLPQLAFDHQRIISDALKVMKRDIYFEPLGYDLLPREFSMSELQRVYESILQTTFDRRNFYNKMRNTGMVIEVEDESDEYASAPSDDMFECNTILPTSKIYDDLDFSSLAREDSAQELCMTKDDIQECKSLNLNEKRLHEADSRHGLPHFLDRAFMCSYSLPKDNNESVESSNHLSEDEFAKKKTSRRKNVKYRFNISKFTDLFKKNDEPFKI